MIGVKANCKISQTANKSKLKMEIIWTAGKFTCHDFSIFPARWRCLDSSLFSLILFPMVLVVRQYLNLDVGDF